MQINRSGWCVAAGRCATYLDILLLAVAPKIVSAANFLADGRFW
jgi:hypothetical protein